MSGASRPTRPDDSPFVSTSEVSGGRSADRPTNQSASDACGSRGAPSSSADSRGGLHIRPSRSTRRSSSGYFSYDSGSQPGSPLSPRPLTADKATQTTSPSAQVIEHAVSSLTAAHGHRESARQQQHGRSASSARPSDSMRDMQEEAARIGQELRHHGDEFNRILIQRRQAAGVHPQWLPVGHREPTVFICVGLLIIFFGRLLYSQV